MNAPHKPSLLSLVDAYVTVLSSVDPETGEVPPDVDSVFRELAPKIDERAEACAAVIARFEAEAETNDALAKAYHARSVARGNEAKRVRQYLADQLQRAGLDRVKSATAHVYFQSTPRVEIVDEGRGLPERFVRVVPESRVPDKRALLAALKAGEAIEGAILEHTVSLQIR